MRPDIATGRRAYPPRSRVEAIWFLAQRVRDTMERFDPTGSPRWDQLTQDDREFYFDVVTVVLEAEEAIRVACGEECQPLRN